MDSLRTRDYHVTFLSRYPTYKHLYDNIARCWHEWQEYYFDNSNILIYGDRMIFRPKWKPDLTTYMLWTNSVHITDTSFFLHGLFNFDSQSDIISANQYIVLRYSECLIASCNE